MELITSHKCAFSWRYSAISLWMVPVLTGVTPQVFAADQTVLSGHEKTITADDGNYSWSVNNGGTLNISEGTTTKYIIASGKVNATDAFITDTSAIRLIDVNGNGHLVLNGTTVKNSSTSKNSVGIRVNGGDAGFYASAQVNNSSVTAATGLVVGFSGDVVIDHTSVTGIHNNGIDSYAGTMLIRNDSVITGQNNGIVFDFDYGAAGYFYDNKVTLDGSTVESLDGSAFLVYNDANADITLQNGAVVKSSNGIILETQNAGFHSELTVSDSNISGDVQIADGATATINVKDSGVLTGDLTGITGLNINGATFNGDVTSGNNDNLTVDVFHSGHLNGTVTAQTGNSAHVIVRDNAVFTGTADKVSDVTLGNDGTWVVTGNSEIGTLTNEGTLTFSGGSAGRIVTMENYTGHGGTLIFNSVLDDDSSVTDKLVVTGNTSGISSVQVNNLGGSGAETVEGFELIHVDGSSAGEFEQASRIIAGAYDYTLQRNGNNWYLTSSAYSPEIPDPGPEPVDPPEIPDPGPEPVDPPEIPDPGPAPGGKTPVYRPEGAAYVANLAAANTLFLTRLEDRPVSTTYLNPVTGESDNTTMWMLNVGSHERWKDDSDQLKTSANRYMLRLGGELARGSYSENDLWRLGAMLGYGKQSSKSTSSVTGYGAKADLNGYNAGLYGTWYQDTQSQTGIYVDGWASYSWFNNRIKGEDIAPESYHSKGFSTSVESGYTWMVAGTGAAKYFLQPSAQVIWMGVRANDHTEKNGTHVEQTGRDNIQSRLSLKGMQQPEEKTYMAWVQASWLNNSAPFGVTMDEVSVRQNGTRNTAEMKLGLSGELSESLSINTSIAQSRGESNYSQTAFDLNLKYRF